MTVPAGLQPGQQIQVQSPDGRTVHANVPPGMTAGQQFMVQMPVRAVTPPISPPMQTPAYPPMQTPAYPPMQTPAYAPMVLPQDYSTLQPVSPPQQPFVPALPASADPWATTIPASRTTAAPMSTAPISTAPLAPVMTNAVAIPMGAQFSPMPPPPMQPSAAPANNQKIMKVQVPPGMPAGSTIYVEVPGENRTIAAHIPPGVTEFHVAYQSGVVNNNSTNPQAPPGQKLLLVRVPPGTSPGTAMHVSIPDEPGRVISATVPPNVSEFHVSYVPRLNNNNRGAAPVNTSNRMNSRNNNNNSRNRNGGMGGAMLPILGGAALGAAGRNRNRGMGGVMLPLLGGAALGAAGMSMYGHHGSQQAEQQYDEGNAQDSGYQDAGDFGGFGDY